MTRSPRCVGLGLGLKSRWSSSPGTLPLIPAAGRRGGNGLEKYDRFFCLDKPYTFLYRNKNLNLDGFPYSKIYIKIRLV